ncbi:ABC transporter permease [Colwellia sp. E2M01]|uniref:ABC transporter permease n=1 Tax=Colwellia sp. E2M01 TaxID=2841561 RepID=UPI001C09885E|nr:ABC transporter permease [Colwellia sp. E2M01]MBU2870659.1 ABC transporter permease [Colwellia sp. E2M01]
MEIFSMDIMQLLIIASISAATPLLLATLGGILSERAGIINLGIEGMMLIGAVCAYIVSIYTDSEWLAIIFSLLGGSALGALLAFLCITLRSNQIVAGLGITLFATGLSSYLGKSFGGSQPQTQIPNLDIPWLDNIPFFGEIFSHLNWMVWISFFIAIVLYVAIFKTRWGLHLRALGDGPAAADNAGVNVYRYQYLMTIIGAALCGLAGATLILVYTPSWNDGLTSGRGWIAVALVIFSRWHPINAIFCAILFGLFETLGFKVQLYYADIPPYFLKMMPYLTTIVVLMWVGWRNKNKPNGQPISLGKTYIREQRG